MKIFNIIIVDMNKILIPLTVILLGVTEIAGISPEPVKAVIPKNTSEQGCFELYPTKNLWTFIKLNTRNGKMWQVHFSINEENATGELVINAIPLVSKEKEIDRRFILYPTENMYNFLLLDQIDGTVSQVQWSMDVKKRGIVTKIKPLD
jgi:hypothetical protein